MKLPFQRSALAALCALAFAPNAYPQASQVPSGEACFQATAGTNGFVGATSITTAGTGGTTGSYGGISLTGGSGSGATANITVSGGGVTAVAILDPGTNYVVGDVLSASSGSIGSTSGFQLTILSVSVNSAVAGGTVGFYIPSTLTPKQTWQDSAQTVPNSNPVTLNQNGCAIVYGTGTYRQILKDSLGNTVWDQLTTAPSTGGAGLFWGGTSTGSANAQVVTASGFSATDGQQVAWVSGFTNTSTVTLNANGTGALAVVQDTAAGSLPLSGGELVSGNVYQVTYVANTNSFHMPVGSTMPVGSIVDYGGASAPAGFLFTNGSCVSQATYAALYAIIGVSYGSYCAAGSFPVPDYRGRVSAGVDAMGGSSVAGRLTSATMSPNATSIGAVGGIEGSAISLAQLPIFTPTGSVVVSFPGFTTFIASSSGVYAAPGVANTFFDTNTSSATPIGPRTFTLSMDPIGSGGTYYVVQPTQLSAKIIKF